LIGTALKASTRYNGRLTVSILAQKIQGRITNYRIGIKEQTSKECLIEFESITSASLASKIVGKKVIWNNGKTKLVGKIRGPHGTNGIIKARFTRGVPGQAIGSIVELVS
jgi:large subunit ribosomal protein L35Ae